MENIMAENQEKKNEEIREFGQIQMKNKISLLTIIGEIEGHDCLPATTKTTKYEHVLPKLAELEDNPDTEGLLLLLNTVGGDSTDYSFIVPSGTMVIHPVRMSGTVIGAKPTYDYFKQMQDRIVHFISTHSKASEKRLEELMMNTGILTKDLGTILVGKEAVEEGLINEVGGISDAFSRLHQMIEKK